jgi:surface polysaccharide O-acyltransferase-like enzyme
MLGVVLIHSRVIEPEVAAHQGLDVVAFVIRLISFQFAAPCVPLFFFISGYLFFVKFGDKFTTIDYGNQLKKRVHTLLIPYLFWNLLVLGYFAFLHKFASSAIDSNFNNVYDFTIVELIRSFYDFPGGQPICYQFWFLRDLFLGIIISPLIFLVMRWGRWVLMILLVVLYISPIEIPHQAMLIFFSLGAGFSIHRYDFVLVAKRLVVPSALLFVGLSIWGALRLESIGGGLGVITGSIVFVWLASKVKPINKTLSESGFFVYAFHGFPIVVLTKMVVTFLKPSGTIMWLVCYFGCFFAITLFSVSLYFVMKKYLPNFTRIITGGR